MSQNYFSNIETEDNTITFKLKNIDNTVPIPFANALRRIMMAEIKTVGIDKDSINIIYNKSVLNNDFIKERLSLLPIKHTDKFNDYNIKINIENTDLDIKEIYARDIEVYDNKTKVKPEDIFVYPDALFTKLKFKNKLNVEAKLKLSTTKNDGSVFNPTAISIYRFEKDQEKIKKMLSTFKTEEEKLEFELGESERYYKKNDYEQPECYEFEVESIGGLKPNKIIEKGLEELKNKLLELKENIKEKNTTKVIKLNSPHMRDAIDYKILNEDDTLGNIVTYELYNNSDVKYAGYSIPHPNDNLIIIRVLADNSDKEVIKEIDSLVSVINKLITEW